MSSTRVIDDEIEFGDELCKKVYLSRVASMKTLDQTLGLKYRRLAKDSVIAELPVGDHLLQPFGLLHGGVNVAVAESCCSIGAFLNISGVAEDASSTAVGIEINANHVKSALPGQVVTCRATPEYIGRQTQVWTARLTVDNALTSIVRCTLMVIKAVPRL